MSKNLAKTVGDIVKPSMSYSTRDLSQAAQNSDDLRRFGFHIGTGENRSHITIWATSQKHAIERFRAQCRDVVFITDAEMAKRKMQRENAIPLMEIAA